MHYWFILRPNSNSSVIVKAETVDGALNAYAVLEGFRSMEDMERSRGFHRTGYRVTRRA